MKPTAARAHGIARCAGPARSAVDHPVPLWPAALDRIRPEELVRPAPGHRGALPVAAGVLPGPFPDRAEDLVRRVLGAGPAAIRARVPVARRRSAADQVVRRQLRVPVQRTAVRGLVAVLRQGGVLLHDLLPAAGLPDGLCHRAGADYLPQRFPDAGDPAVLDFVPAARVRVDRPAQERRRDQQRAAVAWASSTSPWR